MTHTPPIRCLRRAAGLTLVELLLALTLFAALTGAVAALVITATKVQLNWGRSVAPYEQVARAMERLQQDVESAQPFFGIPFTVEEQGTTLTLARTAPAGEADAPAWVAVTYRIAPVDGGGTALLRDEAVWGAGAGGAVRTETLARFSAGQFAVGQADAGGALISWTTAWDGSGTTPPQVPRLVKIDCLLPASPGAAPMPLSRAFRNPAGVLPVQNP